MILNKYFIIISTVVVLIGVAFKALLIPSGSLILIIGCCSSCIITFIQLILSFVKIKNNLVLSFLAASLNFLLMFCFVAILINYMWWSGGQTMLVALTPIFVILVILFILLKNKYLKSEYESFFTKNLLVPYVFVFVLGIVALLFSDRAFYNTFSQKRVQMTYEMYLEKQALKNY